LGRPIDGGKVMDGGKANWRREGKLEVGRPTRNGKANGKREGKS
jgi:hypothetical protein